MVWTDRTAINYRGQPYYDVSIRVPDASLPLPKTSLQAAIRLIYLPRINVVGYFRIPLIWRDK